MGWHPLARTRRSGLEADFKANLNDVAEAFARHDRHPQVSEAHVDRAFEAIVHSGMCRRRWIDRPESEASAGAFLVGFAFACPDAIGLLFDGDEAKPIAAILMAVSFALGCVLSAHAWYRGRLPSATAGKHAVWLWGRRVLIVVVLVVIAAICAYSLYVKMSGCCGRTPTLAPVKPVEAVHASPSMEADSR
jgi:hypothetical protein